MKPVHEFVERMREHGVIPGDAAAAPDATHERPWFIALLQGVAGWLAGIFLLVFLALVFKPDSGGPLFIIGAVLLVSAWALYRLDRDAVFLDQLALAISIAGQFAVAVSVIKDNVSGFSIALTALVLQLLVLAVMPNKVARTLAALFASIAWVFTIRYLLWPANGDAVFFGEPRKPDALSSLLVFQVVGWALTWLPLLAIVGALVLREPHWMASPVRRYARPALTGLVLGLSLGGIAAEPFAVTVFGTESLGMDLSLRALFPLLSIGLALCAAYAAFRLRNTGLLGFAIFAALLHLSRFYYLYGTTLLWKSLIMLVVGALLLLSGMAMRRSIPVTGGSA